MVRGDLRAAAWVAVGASALLVAGGVLRAQAPAGEPRLAFEVVSIKQSLNPKDGGTAGFRPGGTFFSTNVPAGSLVFMAYRTSPPLLPQQIVGMPQWAQLTRYDITAKVSADAAGDMNALFARQGKYVQSLLEDRFAFKAHMEKREMPVYALTAPDGGTRLRRSTLDCSKAEDRPKCGMTFNAGRITSPHLELTNLLGTLASASGRPVLDRTGLTGFFDIDLQYAAGPPTSDTTDERPSIFSRVAVR